MKTPKHRLEVKKEAVNHEELDDTPVAIPDGMTDKPMTLREEMQRYIRTQVSALAAASDAGDFTAEDDFEEVDDDPAWLSGYEIQDLVAEETEYLDGDPTLTPADPSGSDGETESVAPSTTESAPRGEPE